MRATFVLVLVTILSAVEVPSAYAKDPPAQVIVWPQNGTPVLRFTFGKFKEVGSLGSERSYLTETTTENLWHKPIGDANFSLYLFDKNKIRIAEATIAVSDIAPRETVKFQTTIASSGPPASVSVVAKYVPKELGSVAFSTFGLNHSEYGPPRGTR
jgi:hypothetical protein